MTTSVYAGNCFYSEPLHYDIMKRKERAREWERGNRAAPKWGISSWLRRDIGLGATMMIIIVVVIIVISMDNKRPRTPWRGTGTALKATVIATPRFIERPWITSPRVMDFANLHENRPGLILIGKRTPITVDSWEIKLTARVEAISTR